MRILFIRHFMTKGNIQRRYIGTTDEPIEQSCVPQEGAGYELVEYVYSSPMLRCVETAQWIYPEINPVIVEDFKECDFGIFENRNYEELKGEKLYQDWLDSNGTLDIPGAESQGGFRKRCINAFDAVMEQLIEQEAKSVAFIVHGGTIMAILEQYGDQDRSFYDWQVGNGQGFRVNIDTKLWQRGSRQLVEDMRI